MSDDSLTDMMRRELTLHGDEESDVTLYEMPTADFESEFPGISDSQETILTMWTEQRVYFLSEYTGTVQCYSVPAGPPPTGECWVTKSWNKAAGIYDESWRKVHELTVDKPQPRR